MKKKSLNKQMSAGMNIATSYVKAVSLIFFRKQFLWHGSTQLSLTTKVNFGKVH